MLRDEYLAGGKNSRSSLALRIETAKSSIRSQLDKRASLEKTKQEVLQTLRALITSVKLRRFHELNQYGSSSDNLAGELTHSPLGGTQLNSTNRKGRQYSVEEIHAILNSSF
jgi:hypothetical protein